MNGALNNMREPMVRMLTDVLEPHVHYNHASCPCGGWKDLGPGAARVKHNYAEHLADVIVDFLVDEK